MSKQANVMREAIDVLKQQGAIIIDPADIPSGVDQDENKNLLRWPICSGAAVPRAKIPNAPWCSCTA
jgi:hypothetical protein